MHLSEAEWKVMRILWDRHPATAREVLEDLEAETGWAYTTTKTILARLADKEAVSVEMRGNTSLYRPLVTRDLARKSAVRSLVDRAFDGTLGSLLHHLIDEEKLSTRDRAKLREMLDAERRTPRSRGKAGSS